MFWVRGLGFGASASIRGIGFRIQVQCVGCTVSEKRILHPKLELPTFCFNGYKYMRNLWQYMQLCVCIAAIAFLRHAAPKTGWSVLFPVI